MQTKELTLELESYFYSAEIQIEGAEMGNVLYITTHEPDSKARHKFRFIGYWNSLDVDDYQGLTIEFIKTFKNKDFCVFLSGWMGDDMHNVMFLVHKEKELTIYHDIVSKNNPFENSYEKVYTIKNVPQNLLDTIKDALNSFKIDKEEE